MPKLLVFAPCEKVIISQDENNPTLIAILSTIGGELEVAEAPPSTALAPMRWSIFVLWQRIEADTNKKFTQTVRIVSPSGRVAIEGPQDFEMPVDSHRLTSQLGHVPAGEPGEWNIQLFLNEKGQPLPPDPIATYPVQIRFAITIKKPEAAKA